MKPFSLVRALILAALALSGVPAHAAGYNHAPRRQFLAPARTSVAGPIASDATWSAANSPYQVNGSVTVNAGVTLTIEPGVVVEFAPSTALTVHGTLLAAGAPDSPILLTSATAAPGAWQGVSVVGTAGNPASATIAYATVEYGGTSSASSADLYLENAQASIRHATIRHSLAHGIFGSLQASVQVSDTNFVDNGGFAMKLTDISVDPVLSGLAASGNGTNAVGIGGNGSIGADATWEAMGVPYVLTWGVRVAENATLIIEPGVIVQSSGPALTVAGRLTANGTAAEPITFTGTNPTPGAWQGIAISGSLQAPAVGTFDHVVVEYGGSSGSGQNIYVINGQVSIAHSVLRNSTGAGLSIWSNAWRSTIETSQIVNNAGYGVYTADTAPGHVIDAANNWWGSPSGPVVAQGPCTNSGGTGSTIGANIVFRPFLDSADADPGPLAPRDVRTIAIAPQRWFAPADGVTPVYVAVTLRDGSGNPLPGRRVQLHSSLGSVADGGITDVQGKTYAYLTSSTVGEASISAELSSDNICEHARSAISTVRFEGQPQGGALFSSAPAPYLTPNIEISPLPVQRGTPFTVHARLHNPNPYPIEIDATFGIAQLGVGLTFGPIGTISKYRIAANGDGDLAVPYTPPILGHYCIEFRYSYVPAPGAQGASARAAGGSGRQLKNFDPRPGPPNPPDKDDSLNKTRNALGLASKIPSGGATIIPKAIAMQGINWGLNQAGIISDNLSGDPPRQDYRTIAMPYKPAFTPVQPDAQLSAARAQALNDLTDALMNVTAQGVAATTSFDRYGGASEAHDLQWAALQAGALQYYNGQYGKALLTAADKIDALVAVLKAEGQSSVLVSADQVRAYQARLASGGYTADEIESAHQVGLSDEQIEHIRQQIIAADPQEEAGDLIGYFQSVAASFRNLGTLLQQLAATGPARQSALRQAQAGAETTNLARVYQTTETITVGNPYATTATFDLRTRLVDLPPDWAASVEPAQITLAPGQQATATVTIRPGSATAQNTQPLVAVESYHADEFVDGVAIEVIVPQTIPFDGKLRVFLPLVQR